MIYFFFISKGEKMICGTLMRAMFFGDLVNGIIQILPPLRITNDDKSLSKFAEARAPIFYDDRAGSGTPSLHSYTGLVNGTRVVDFT